MTWAILIGFVGGIVLSVVIAVRLWRRLVAAQPTTPVNNEVTAWQCPRCMALNPEEAPMCFRCAGSRGHDL